jgi:putative hydrolase of the HAD superfamily
MVDLSAVKHVFFDLDDTLWDFEKNSEQVLNVLFNEFNLFSKLNTDFNTFHIGYKKVNAELWRAYYQKQIKKEELRNKRFHYTFLEFGYEAYEESLSVSECYLQRSPYGKILKPNCLTTLDYLKNKYILHIITNGFKEVQHIKMQSSGLNPYFKNVLISEDHGLTKPDTAIFRLAEKYSGATSTECIMIGDNLESDMQGGRNAGWKTIFFGTNSKKNEVIDAKISDLSELKGLL